MTGLASYESLCGRQTVVAHGLGSAVEANVECVCVCVCVCGCLFCVSQLAPQIVAHKTTLDIRIAQESTLTYRVQRALPVIGHYLLVCASLFDRRAMRVLQFRVG